mgnify:CR=1 FL=1
MYLCTDRKQIEPFKGTEILMKYLLMLVLTFSVVGQKKDQGRKQKPFLEQTKMIPSLKEWPREVTSKKGGTIHFITKSEAKLSILVIADRTFKALINSNDSGIVKSDFLFNTKTPKGKFKSTITIPKGSSHFVIQNLSKEDSEVTLVCFSED